MSSRFSAGMAEATRLTREGRVADATALIQRLLRPQNRANDSRQHQEAGSPAHPDKVVDLIPSADGSDHWSAADTKSSERDSSAAKSSSSARMQDVMRGLPGLFRVPRFDVPAEGLRSGRARRVVSVPFGACFEEHTFTSEIGSRRYKLYVPSCYVGQSLPLIVMLHGCKQSPDDFAAGTRMNEVCEEMNILVAYPEQPPSANTARCWNWFNPDDQLRNRGEPSLIAGITRQVMHDYAVDAARVYVAGLSAGGAAAAIMGATYPDLYAAICVHSGLPCGAATDLPSAFAAMRQGTSVAVNANGTLVPAIVFHSDCDAVVDSENGEQVIMQSGAGLEFSRTQIYGTSEGGTHYTRTLHSEEDGSIVLEHWLLHGVGHAWSGGSTAGSYTDPRGPDASREAVRFFLAHSNK